MKRTIFTLDFTFEDDTEQTRAFEIAPAWAQIAAADDLLTDLAETIEWLTLTHDYYGSEDDGLCLFGYGIADPADATMADTITAAWRQTFETLLGAAAVGPTFTLDTVDEDALRAAVASQPPLADVQAGDVASLAFDPCDADMVFRVTGLREAEDA